MLPHHLLLADLTGIYQNLEGVGQRTGFTWQQFFAQCFAFLILCGVLWKWAWKPVIVVLEQRRQAIEQSMKNVEQIKKELETAESSRLNILQKANEQAARIIAEAEKSAAALAETRAKEATRQAEDIIKSAREAAVLERNRLMAELKSQIGALVIQTTEKVTGKVLTPADQARLNDETLTQVEARNN